MKTISVIGGDRRQAILAQLLAEDGFVVSTCGLGQWSDRETPLEDAVQADVVILPLPLCWQAGVLNWAGESLATADLFAMLRPEQRILAGQVQEAQRSEAEARGLRLEDYFLREEMAVANAAATAEGALQVAMEHMEQTLLGTEVLVLGFGRIGKLLAFRLHGLGARVAATARKAEDMAWIEAFGWQALETGRLGGELGRFPVVFNTVPSYIINKELVNRLPVNCLVIDLASVQGVDAAAAEEASIHYIWARGLPGKLVPVTAAAAIRRAVRAMLREGSV